MLLNPVLRSMVCDGVRTQWRGAEGSGGVRLLSGGVAEYLLRVVLLQAEVIG